MSKDRALQSTYTLRSVPRHDYRRQLKGLPVSRKVIHEEAIKESSQEEGAVSEMEQLLQLLAEGMRQQEADRKQEREDRQKKDKQDEEYRRQKEQKEEEYRRQKEQKEEEYRRQKEQKEEEYRRKQQEEQQRREKREEEHRQLMQKQMLEAIKMSRPTVQPQVNIAPFDENEDIQDFLEAFEGVMNIQKIDMTEWVLRLTPLLKGKARTVCTDVGALKEYEGVKKAILSQYSVSPERCRKEFRAHTWTREAEPNAWIAKGRKLMNRWLLPEEGLEQVLDKIAVEQFINALPQDLRIWVASHSPETPTAVAKLIEAYDSAHSSTENRVSTYPPYQKPQWKSDSKDAVKQGKWKNEDSPRSGSRETKSLAEIVCYKCNQKGHLARNCTSKNLHVQEEKDNPCMFVKGEVNGQPVTRIQLDSGASRTIVNRCLISPADIGEKSIVITFGNGTYGEYPLAAINVKVDNQEYCLEAAVVQDLAAELLLGRDVPLCKHMVKSLPREEQVELLQQLAKENGVRLKEVRLEERPTEKTLTVATRAQKRAQSQEETEKDTIEAQEETQEDDIEFQEETQEDVVETQEDDIEFQEETHEDVVETQEETRENVVEIQEVGHGNGMQEKWLSENESAEESYIKRDFLFTEELLEEQGKSRPHWTRSGNRKGGGRKARTPVTPLPSITRDFKGVARNSVSPLPRTGQG